MAAKWMLVAGVLAVAACSPQPGGQEQTTGEQIPPREGPTRPPATHAEGMYVLTAINGGDLPGVVQEAVDCRVEVVDGTLRLEAGRFAFQNRTREVCGVAAGAPAAQADADAVMHAAGGTYTVQNDQIELHSDVGGAFSHARGTADETTITLRELSTEAGTETVTWQFERRDARTVPVPGSTG